MVSKLMYTMFVCIGVSELIIVFKKFKTKNGNQNLLPYLQHLTLTHLALHAGVILCCTVQTPFLEIKDAPPLAQCLRHSFPSCDLVTR